MDEDDDVLSRSQATQLQFRRLVRQRAAKGPDFSALSACSADDLFHLWMFF